MSKVLLINPNYNFPVKHEMYPSGALLLIGTMAKQRGHEVKLVHMVADKLSVADTARLARDFNADFIGITVNTFQVAATKKLLNELRWQTKARLIVGGAHPTSVGVDEAKLEFPNADDIICGEGEHRFMSILGDTPVASPQDLEYIDPPDLTLVDLSKFRGAYPLGKTPAMFSMFSRGCIGQCTFCNRSIFGNRVRYRSPENVMWELRHFAKNGIKEVFIQDDTFNLNHAWYQEILQRIISEGLNKKMQFRAPFRADEKLVNKEVLKLAKKAGFWLLFYGVESGNQGMLDRMHKKLSLEEIEWAVRLTKEAGIKVETSFIVGLPGETEQTIEDTLRFYYKLSPFWSGCGIAIPFPSTEVSKEVREQIKDIPYSEYYPGRVYFSTDELDKEAIAEKHNILNRTMLLGKLAGMVSRPDMMLRTIKNKVR
jgi:anaerobic magnesium-protoporphyrin IX monomethyl ester cyclase